MISGSVARPGHADPLLLSAGELGGVPVQILVRVHAHHVHQLQGALADLLGAGLGELGDDLNVLPDGHVGEQAGLLNDVAHAPAQLDHILVADVLTVDEDLTGGGLGQPVDHL